MPREEIPFSSLTKEDLESVEEEDISWEKHTDFGDLKEEKELDFSPNPRRRR